MRTQKTNRATALVVPSAEVTAATRRPMLPAIAGTQAKASAPTQRHKAQSKKKTASGRTSTSEQKMVQKPMSEVKPLTRTKPLKKAPRPKAKTHQPHLVSAEKAHSMAPETEASRTEDAPLAMPQASVLPMVEAEASEPAVRAVEEISADSNYAQGADPSTGSDAPAGSELLSTLTSPLEKQKFLQALAIQWMGLWLLLTRTWLWARQKVKSHQVKKRLRVCESVSLGDKRFIAVIQVDGEQFLVGGSSSSVSTLAHLEPRREFSDVFRSRCEQDLSRA